MIVFAPFGAIFLVLGVVLQLRLARLRKVCTVETRAAIIGAEQVVSENTETDDNGTTRTTTSITWAPIYRYHANGQELVKRSTVSTSRHVPVGTEVTLFYNPHRVEQFHVPQERVTARLGWFFCIFGLVFLLLGLLIPG